MRRHYLVLGALTLAFFLLPLGIGNDYYLTALILVALNAMVVAGLVLLMGFAGQVSMGHAAFYGLGAYASGILTVRLGWPFAASCPAALALTAAVAWLIGRPALKLRGHYLAMATLAFGEIVNIVFNELSALTGGPSGLSGIPRLRVLGYEFSSDRGYYYLCWGVLAVMLLLAINIIGSRVGRGLRAIHGSERAAAAIGVHVSGYKTAVFVISALFAGMAGILYAHFITFISPSSFGIGASVLFVTMVAVGGMESLWGGVLGALVLTLLPEYLRVFRDYDILIYGLVLMVIMIFVPRGLVVGLPLAVSRIRARRAARGAA